MSMMPQSIDVCSDSDDDSTNGKIQHSAGDTVFSLLRYRCFCSLPSCKLYDRRHRLPYCHAYAPKPAPDPCRPPRTLRLCILPEHIPPELPTQLEDQHPERERCESGHVYSCRCKTRAVVAKTSAPSSFTVVWSRGNPMERCGDICVVMDMSWIPIIPWLVRCVVEYWSGDEIWQDALALDWYNVGYAAMASDHRRRPVWLV